MFPPGGPIQTELSLLQTGLSLLQTGLSEHASFWPGSTLTATQTQVDSHNNAMLSEWPTWTLCRQLAFMAHLIWESGGLRFTVEQDTAKRNNCQCCQLAPPSCATCQTCATDGKQFHGGGHVQLSHCHNHLACGNARKINGDPNCFCNNPDIVAVNCAWDASAWCFETNVPGTTGAFGLSTKAIDGEMECLPKVTTNNCVGSTPQKRHQIFKVLADAVGVTGCSEVGCHN